MLVMDYRDVSGEDDWRRWLARKGPSLPEPDAAPDLHPSAGGGEIGLRARLVEVDPRTRVLTREIRAQRWRDGRLEADETRRLRVCVYFRDEVLGMLAEAGFGPVEVSRGYGAEAGESKFLVYEARTDTGRVTVAQLPGIRPFGGPARAGS